MIEYPKRELDKGIWIADCVSEYEETYGDKTQVLCERCYQHGIKYIYPSVDVIMNYLNQ
jgi:hypothetical protein